MGVRCVADMVVFVVGWSLCPGSEGGRHSEEAFRGGMETLAMGSAQMVCAGYLLKHVPERKTECLMMWIEIRP